MNIQFSNVSLGGSLLVGFENNDPGDFGLPLEENGMYVSNTFSDGYWELTEVNTISFTGGFDIELTAGNFTSYPIATGTRAVTRSNSFSDWTLSGTHADAVGNVIQRSGITIFDCDLAIADTTACNVNGMINSTDITCNGLTNGSITISNATGGSGFYEYSINGGTNWQPATNYTGLGAATYDIRIRDAMATSCNITQDGSLTLIEPPVVAPSITGPDSSCQYEHVTYTTEAAMTNYDWTISSGGAITAGGDGYDFITILWTEDENRSISVSYENGGCPATTPTVKDVWIKEPADTGPLFHMFKICDQSENLALILIMVVCASVIISDMVCFICLKFMSKPKIWHSF